MYPTSVPGCCTRINWAARRNGGQSTRIYKTKRSYATLLPLTKTYLFQLKLTSPAAKERAQPQVHGWGILHDIDERLEGLQDELDFRDARITKARSAVRCGKVKLLISKKVQFQMMETHDISKWNHHFLEASTFNVVWAASTSCHLLPHPKTTPKALRSSSHPSVKSGTAILAIHGADGSWFLRSGIGAHPCGRWEGVAATWPGMAQMDGWKTYRKRWRWAG